MTARPPQLSGARDWFRVVLRSAGGRLIEVEPMTDWLLAAADLCRAGVGGRPWARGIPGNRPDAVATAGLAYLCGTALFTLAMLGAAFLGLELDRLTLGICLVTVRLAGRLVAGDRPPARPVPGSFRLAVLPLALAAATLGFGVLQAFRLGGIDTIDFLKAWGLKGTSLFLDGNLDFSHLRGPHLFYPLEVSNLNGAFYVLLGRVDDEVVRLPAALFGVSLALALWWLARLMMPPAGAALAVALAVMTPQFTSLMTNGMADLVVAAYVTVCALAAYRWLEDGGSAWAPLSGFAAGAAAWTKLEGALTCLVILAGVLAVRRALRTPGVGIWLAWFAVFVVPWQLFQRIHDIPANRAHFKKIYLDADWIVGHVVPHPRRDGPLGGVLAAVHGADRALPAAGMADAVPAAGGAHPAQCDVHAGGLRHPLPGR